MSAFRNGRKAAAISTIYFACLFLPLSANAMPTAFDIGTRIITICALEEFDEPGSGTWCCIHLTDHCVSNCQKYGSQASECEDRCREAEQECLDIVQTINPRPSMEQPKASQQKLMAVIALGLLVGTYFIWLRKVCG